MVHQSGLSGYFNREEDFVGQLCGDCAVFVAKALREWVCVPRGTAGDGKYGKNVQMTVPTTDGRRDMKLRAASAVAFKQWAGVPVTAADVRYVVSQKEACRDLLESLVKSSDPEVSDAAASALNNLPPDRS